MGKHGDEGSSGDLNLAGIVQKIGVWSKFLGHPTWAKKYAQNTSQLSSRVENGPCMYHVDHQGTKQQSICTQGTADAI